MLVVLLFRKTYHRCPEKGRSPKDPHRFPKSGERKQAVKNALPQRKPKGKNWNNSREWFPTWQHSCEVSIQIVSSPHNNPLFSHPIFNSNKIFNFSIIDFEFNNTVTVNFPIRITGGRLCTGAGWEDGSNGVLGANLFVLTAEIRSRFLDDRFRENGGWRTIENIGLVRNCLSRVFPFQRCPVRTKLVKGWISGFLLRGKYFRPCREKIFFYIPSFNEPGK